MIQRSNKVPLNILSLLQAACMFRKLRLVLSNNPKYCLLFPGPPWGRGNKLHKHTETTTGTTPITVIKNKTKQKNSHLLIATHKWVIIWLCGQPKETFLNGWTCSQECSSSGITVSSVLVRPKCERAQRPIIHWTHSLSTLIIHRRKKRRYSDREKNIAWIFRVILVYADSFARREGGERSTEFNRGFCHWKRH